MTSRVVLLCHAATSATRRAAFPAGEPVETDPAPLPLRADTYLTAPETSCRQTATALGLPATVDEALRDCDFGAWRGRTLDEVTASNPEDVGRWLTDPAANPHGGESTVDLIDRVGAWLDTLSGGRIVAVTHPAVVKAAVVRAILATPRSFWRIDVPPLSQTTLSGRAGRWTLRLGPATAATTPPTA
jgi:broad specificity phosphatase PhoE